MDEFSMRITGLVNHLRVLDNTVEEEKVVKKFLRVVPSRYTQVAIAIEMLLNLSTLSVEELTGRLRAVEQRYGRDDTSSIGTRLLLSEEESTTVLRKEFEEWLMCIKKREQGGSSSDGDNRYSGKPRCHGRGKGWHDDKDSGSSSVRRDISRVQCYNCDKYGHYSRDCRKTKRAEQVNLTQVDDDDDGPTLLMAQVCALTEAFVGAGTDVVLNEVHARYILGARRTPTTMLGTWTPAPAITCPGARQASRRWTRASPAPSSSATALWWIYAGVAPFCSPAGTGSTLR